MLENNHALNLVFDKDCKTCPNKRRGFDRNESESFFTRKQAETEVHDDGFSVFGTFAMDYTCIGMLGNKE